MCIPKKNIYIYIKHICIYIYITTIYYNHHGAIPTPNGIISLDVCNMMPALGLCKHSKTKLTLVVLCFL